MLPLVDNLSRKKRAYGVYSMVLLMGCVELLCFLLGPAQDLLFMVFGFIPANFSAKPWPAGLTMLSATFLHADLWHLLTNCLFLWVFGRSIEALFGTWRFILFFPMLGVAGFILQWHFNYYSGVPIIGASAAISGLMGAYLVLFPKALIKTFVLLGWFFRLFDVPSWIFLIYWAAIQIVLGIFIKNDLSPIAYGAHIGGFSLGLIIALLYRTTLPHTAARVKEMQVTRW